MDGQIRVDIKPSGIEELAFRRMSGKWGQIIDKAMAIDSTHCVHVDIAGASRQRITGIKNGLKGAAKKVGLREHLRIAEKHDVLFVWFNETKKEV